MTTPTIPTPAGTVSVRLPHNGPFTCPGVRLGPLVGSTVGMGVDTAEPLQPARATASRMDESRKAITNPQASAVSGAAQCYPVLRHYPWDVESNQEPWPGSTILIVGPGASPVAHRKWYVVGKPRVVAYRVPWPSPETRRLVVARYECGKCGLRTDLTNHKGKVVYKQDCPVACSPDGQ